MSDGIQIDRPTRSLRARLLVVAALIVSGVLVAGCGRSSGSPIAATVGSTTSTGSNAASAGPPGALAYAKCMRANGVPQFPDPQAGGGFDFHASAGVISSPAFRAAQMRCQKFMPGGGPLSPGPPPSAQTMARLDRIAACMRQHGVPQFPDPRPTPPPQSSVNLGTYSLITNYKGAILLFPATIDRQSPAYEQAAAACGAGFLGSEHSH